MYRFLLRPRWFVASVLVTVLAALFVSLGFWQMSRHRERALENEVIAQRLSEAPIPIREAVAGAGEDLTSLEYRPARAEGTFISEDEVLVRSQVRNGQAGFWVVTPFAMTDGGVLLVNRGWVPLAFDSVPVEGAPPPSGVVAVTGLVRLNQERPPFGPVEPAGRLTTVARIDVARLSRQMPGPLLPVWLQLTGPSDRLPVPLDPPDLESGPHVSYAIQWFAFAAISIVGFGLLARRQALGRR